MGRQDAGQFSPVTVSSDLGKTTRICFLSWIRALPDVAMVKASAGPGEALAMGEGPADGPADGLADGLANRLTNDGDRIRGCVGAA